MGIPVDLYLVHTYQSSSCGAMPSDAEVSAARAKLAAMRQSLAGLKQHQARLEVVCQKAKENESSLKKELGELMDQMAQVKLEREDIEGLFYSDEGFGPWQTQFRRFWRPNAPAGPSQRLPCVREVSFGCLRGQQISSSPVALWFPNFASPEECQELIELGFRTCKRHNAEAQAMQRPGETCHGEELRGVATASLQVERLAGEDHVLMSELQRRVAELTGIPVHSDEINPFLKFDQPAGVDLKGDDMSIGLHLDVNGGRPYCICSVIIYLNDVEGGRTVFPCASNGTAAEIAPCHQLGQVMARAGYTHTSHSSAQEALGKEASELVNRASTEPDIGLRVSPQRGSAFWFFTLDDAGGFDGSSWHGGAAVAGDLGKWTLQIFKEVPMPHRSAAALPQLCAELRGRAQTGDPDAAIAVVKEMRLVEPCVRGKKMERKK
eukprot:s361_g22.t1